MSEFAEWDSFYVIVGSAAGALIGLQFVVLTLIAERPPIAGGRVRRRRRSPHASADDLRAHVAIAYHVFVRMRDPSD
ncbi:MAG: hypothetical protein DMF98_25350 [Acidobacteria bacterium]|nr:MAG: hypothetical protein DMF98_25350 [Acidobacteriota bacterium]